METKIYVYYKKSDDELDEVWEKLKNKGYILTDYVNDEGFKNINNNDVVLMYKVENIDKNILKNSFRTNELLTLPPFIYYKVKERGYLSSINQLIGGIIFLKSTDYKEKIVL